MDPADPSSFMEALQALQAAQAAAATTATAASHHPAPAQQLSEQIMGMQEAMGGMLACIPPLGVTTTAVHGHPAGMFSMPLPLPLPGQGAAGADEKKSSKNKKRSRDKADDSKSGASAASKQAKTAAAKAPAATTANIDEAAWRKNVLDRIPRCKAAEGIRASSYFSKGKGAASVARGHHGTHMAAGSAGGGGRVGCLRRLLQELGSLEQDDDGDDGLLPTNPAIWLRYDEETPQFLRALISGPSNTPYANGLFAFDLYIPDQYPAVPPKMQLLTTGRGTVGFSPNLYKDGKVCLSLLNTWSGPGWDAKCSTLLQVLVSVQGLILGVEHPYFQEPGYGGWEGHASAKNPNSDTLPPSVKHYEDRIRDATIKFAVMDYCRALVGEKNPKGSSYLSPFDDVIAAHFWHHRDAILSDVSDWVNLTHSVSQKALMQTTVTKLEQAMAQLKDPLVLARTAVKSTAVAAKKQGTDDASNAVVVGADQKKAVATTSASGGNGSAESAAKRREMQAAAAAGDFITAGRLQAELERSDKVRGMITAKHDAMEAAAAAKDYVTAGTLQAAVRRLEANRKRLEHLERRMFESAASQDFAKAGRFQEQYRVLLESSTGDGDAKGSGAGPVTSTSFSSSMPFQGYGDYGDYYGDDDGYDDGYDDEYY